MENTQNEEMYIVRRLTPLECGRLQGFQDWWTDHTEVKDPTEEDMAFWREVFETKRKVMNPKGKPKTDKQIRKWLANPKADSDIYKMWGNGMALPNILYCMIGMEEILREDEYAKEGDK